MAAPNQLEGHGLVSVQTETADDHRPFPAFQHGQRLHPFRQCRLCLHTQKRTEADLMKVAGEHGGQNHGEPPGQPDGKGGIVEISPHSGRPTSGLAIPILSN